MDKVKYFLAAALIAGIAIVGIYNYSKKAGYEVSVDLTPELRAQYENQIIEMEKTIRGVIPPDKPDIDFFIEKARAEEYLGRYGRAIETLLGAFQFYENSISGFSNIANLYDKVGEYDKAIIFYKQLIEKFNYYKYYGSLAWDYYRLNKLELAQEAYGRFAQLARGKDEELFKLLYTNISP